MKLEWYENTGNDVYSQIDFSENFSHFFRVSETDNQCFKSKDKVKKFILLHTGRCGSTLLHNMLIQQQILCPPFELFNPESILDTSLKMGLELPVSLNDYLTKYYDLMIEDSSSDNGSIISFSLTPWQLMPLINIFPNIIKQLFDEAIVIILLRRDIIRQAISYYTAIQFGTWHIFDNNLESVKNNIILNDKSLASILEFIDLIVWGENKLLSEVISDLLKNSKYKVFSYENFIEHKDEVLKHIFYLNSISENKEFISNNKNNLPKKLLTNCETAYQEILNMLPIMLPSGFILDRKTFNHRLNAHI